MTITLTDISYEDAVKMRDVLTTHERFFDECPASQIDEAIQNEDGNRYDRHQERLMESGGVDDSAYRRDMRDAGRSHLLP